MKIMQPNTKEDLQKHIAKLENLLTQEISEADRDVHQKETSGYNLAIQHGSFFWEHNYSVNQA